MPKKSNLDSEKKLKTKKTASGSKVGQTVKSKAISTAGRKVSSLKKKTSKKKIEKKDLQTNDLIEEYELRSENTVENNDWDNKESGKEDSLERLFSNVKKPEFFSKKNESFNSASTSSEARKKKKSSGIGRDILGLFIKIAVLLVVVFALLLSFDILGIYRLEFNDAVSLEVSRVLNLPAGKVDGQTIGAYQYLKDLKVLRSMVLNEREGFVNYSKEKNVNDVVFYGLVANVLVDKQLASYGKQVSQSDLDNQIENLFQQAGGRIPAENIIQDLYNLNLQQFKDKVLRPLLGRELLQQAIVTDENLKINQEAKSRAEEVMLMAQKGANFSELVMTYSDDEATLNIGGELGWVVKGQLDPRWEEAIMETPANSIVPELIKSDFGYHIIRVGERVASEEATTENVRISHILISINIDDYIKNLIDQVEVVRYIK
jgi:hypothetical protein